VQFLFLSIGRYESAIKLRKKLGFLGQLCPCFIPLSSGSRIFAVLLARTSHAVFKKQPLSLQPTPFKTLNEDSEGIRDETESAKD
jgi:hypothetical protein